uniref:Uncharacterized protein n=1 Tax=Panagrolaimus sp. JU765 TaxID=591449 RepID=A0AC34RH24_9BILA
MSSFVKLLFLTICLMILLKCSDCAPVSDSENAYRILSNYLKSIDDPDLDNAGYFVIGDKSSIKRALGPRPLRFG